jgi:hypothetical protein
VYTLYSTPTIIPCMIYILIPLSSKLVTICNMIIHTIAYDLHMSCPRN